MRNISLFIALFYFINLSTVFAAIDPWYEQNPSCVTYRGNPARTGEYKTTPIRQAQQEAWQLGQLDVDAVCYQNMIITGSMPTAYRVSDGKKVWENWKVHLGKIGYNNQMTVYKDKLYAVGRVVLGQKPDKNYILSPLGIIVLNAKTGQLIKQLDPTVFKGDISYGVYAPLIYNDITYFSLGDHFIAYNLLTGKILWQKTSTSICRIYDQPFTDGEQLYVSNGYVGCKEDNPKDQNTYFYAIDLVTGKIIWQKIINANVDVVGNYLIYTQDNAWQFLDKATGNVIKSVKRSKEKGSIVASSDNLIFTTKANTGLHALDINTGKEQWHFPKKPSSDPHVAGKVSSVPIIAGNVVYIRKPTPGRWSYYSMLYALDKKTGRVLWQYDSHYQMPAVDAILPLDSKLLVARDNSEARVLIQAQGK